MELEPLVQENPELQALKEKEQEQDEKNSKRHFRLAIAFGVFVFLIFLILKLPETRIQNLITAHIKIMAQDQGYLFSANKINIGMALGPSIRFENIELRSIDDPKVTLKIDELKIKPKVLSLLSSMKKAAVDISLGSGGEISGVVGMTTGSPSETTGATPASSAISLDLNFRDFQLSRIPLLKQWLELDMAALIDGELEFSYDPSQAQETSGNMDLKIKNFSMPPQSAYGFTFPQLGIRESIFQATVSKGTLTLNKIEIGKDTKVDDLVLKLTGSGSFDSVFLRSRVNTRATFDFSKKIRDSFSLLDSLLASGRTPDGKFTYRITGQLYGPDFLPGNGQ